MKGKIVLVTGATSGIGKAAAIGLSRLGAMLIATGRIKEKCEETVEEIRRETGSDAVGCMVADLSTLQGMRSLASDYLSRYRRLHVLVNNVGGFFNQREETADGFELTFALNHLSYFLLTNLLLDVIKSSAPSRIINVTSGIHVSQKGMPFDDLQTEEGYKGFKAYGRSKLANVLFTYELARRLEDTGVTVNAYNPGFTATGLGMQPGGFGGFTKWMVSKMAKTPEKAAESLIWLSSSPEVEGVSGSYFENMEAVRSSRASYDSQAARRLWEISEELTGLKKGR